MSHPTDVPEQVLAGNARAALTWATEQLDCAGVVNPRIDSELLIAHSAGLTRSDLSKALIMGNPLWDTAGAGSFVELVTERTKRIPLQHLTGWAPFRHLELRVGPGVFIPRPETEIVAQVAIDFANELVTAANTPVTVVDLCTGSGAIALSVLTEVTGSQVYAVELDKEAHRWTEQNVAQISAPDGAQVTLIQGDARTALPQLNGSVDVVISNPPYVPPGHVPNEQEVAEHDPQIALYGLGSDGLEIPRGITLAAARLLRPGGLYVMEHAEVQAQAARDMVNNSAYFEVASTGQDLTGRDRMVLARRNARILSNTPALSSNPALSSQPAQRNGTPQ